MAPVGTLGSVTQWELCSFFIHTVFYTVFVDFLMAIQLHTDIEYTSMTLSMCEIADWTVFNGVCVSAMSMYDLAQTHFFFFLQQIIGPHIGNVWIRRFGVRFQCENYISAPPPPLTMDE